MRITNQMMTNNSLNNINKNKNIMNALGEQYSTGKKIQRPSDDPIIAVRALKLRTNIAELEQYYNRNIPDALSWMEVTEGALSNIDSIYNNIHTQMTQGANDPLQPSDRESIIKNLVEMKSQIYQEGNTNYAGRYVFSGYKTDTSLAFIDPSADKKYTITEKFSGADIEKLSKVVGGYEIGDYNPNSSTVDDFMKSPSQVNTHRIRLAYDKTDDVNPTLTDNRTTPATDIPVTRVSVTDPNAYVVGPDEVKFIPETGEMILGDNVYEQLRQGEAGDISIQYQKTNFAKDNLRPEHYFDCVTSDPTDPTDAPINTYTQAEDGQDIEYEITFNQKLKINVEGKDSFTHDIGRDIDELENAADEVIKIEKKQESVKKLLADPNITPAQKETLEKLSSQLDTEHVLKGKILHDKFETGMTSVKNYQKQLGVALADSGSRENRLDLTSSRMRVQLDDATDLMSKNEDADIVEVLIKSTSAEAIYNASLSSAAKIVKNSLLDFI